jgi:hypothetical protein
VAFQERENNENPKNIRWIFFTKALSALQTKFVSCPRHSYILIFHSATKDVLRYFQIIPKLTNSARYGQTVGAEKENRTILVVDSFSDRLDLRDEHIRKAAKSDAKLELVPIQVTSLSSITLSWVLLGREGVVLSPKTTWNAKDLKNSRLGLGIEKYFCGWKDTGNFFPLSGGFFSGLSMGWVGFLVWGCFWGVGEDTLEDTSVFLGVFLLCFYYFLLSLKVAWY